METTSLFIEQIRPELTLRLRREVLYPTQPLHAMQMPEDANGYHFGAFYNDSLAGVVSLFQHHNDFQFRKFAIAEKYQGKGFGNVLLQHITSFAANEGAKRIWCNARSTATGFYSKAGFISTGQHFAQNGFNYEIMEKFL